MKKFLDLIKANQGGIVKTALYVGAAIVGLVIVAIVTGKARNPEDEGIEVVEIDLDN